MDRRKVKTRAALLAAGRTLLAARDIDGISVDEIVAAAEVAKGSFYNHFGDKDVFAREIGAAVRRQVEQAVAAANAGVTDPAAVVARALCVFLRFAIEHRDSAQVLWRLNPGSTMAEAPINRALREDLARGIRAGRFNGIDVEIGVLLVMGAVVIGMRHVLEERVVTPPVAIATNMAAGMMRALGVATAPAGRVAAAAARHVFGDLPAGSVSRRWPKVRPAGIGLVDIP
ncbi:MAG TPA: TetR/AcrR family transcriptional regulator [Steroidobacteraceae bacterium]|jgi:AcrR family transcriptional regulator|nr:TetR/AcrR family transcriptional regulator [Steroidobacteraceae bacterium]